MIDDIYFYYYEVLILPRGSEESVMMTSNFPMCFSKNLIPSSMCTVSFGDEKPTDNFGRYFFDTSITRYNNGEMKK